MGGVIGALLLLGIVIWVIMRRLNDLMKYVQARLGPSPHNKPSDEPEDLRRDKNQALSQQMPSEVWDPHSEGRFRRPLGELTGSYDAHSISELGGSTSPGSATCVADIVITYIIVVVPIGSPKVDTHPLVSLHSKPIGQQEPGPVL